MMGRLGSTALAVLAVVATAPASAQSEDELLQQMERAIAERDGTPLPTADAGGEAPEVALIDGTDPSAVLEAVRGFGGAELDRDGAGDPMIRAEIGPYRYVVFFYGCTDGADCGSLLFRASFVSQGVQPSDMAVWNREKRFGTAYLDDEGDPVLEMDLNLYGGVSRTNLEDSIDWWRVVVEEFAERVSR